MSDLDDNRVRQSPSWPRFLPFKGSKRQTHNGFPDFPDTAGSREQGRFRESARIGLTTIAVVNDDGSPVFTVNDAEQEMVLLLKATVLGLSLLTNTDLLGEVTA